MVALGSALSTGDLSTSQSALATVLGDLKKSALPSQINEPTAARQSVPTIEELLSTLNASTSSSSSDLSHALLESVYGKQSGLNVYG
jgi:hypothetical protein